MPRPPLHSRGEIVAAIHAAAGHLDVAAAQLGYANRTALDARARNDVQIRHAIRAARRQAQHVTVCPTCEGAGVV